MLQALRSRRGSIAAKFYLLAALAIVAVSGLAVSSIYFAKTTETAATYLYGDAYVGVLNATRLELLLEQHRRIVESMPAEVDRVRLRNSRTQLDMIGSRLAELIGDLISKDTSSSADAAEMSIAGSLPVLFRAGDRAAFYAYNFAQDKAYEFAAEYSTLADSTQRLVQDYHEQRLKDAESSVSRLLTAAKSLTVWVFLCTIVALILIGPIGLMIAHRVLSRLGLVTGAIAKLARNDTAVTIPSCHDDDEIGQVARAVEVFKDNAIKLRAREIELAQVNRRLDVALNHMAHGLSMFDVERNLIVCNETYRRMYDLPRELAQAGTPLRRINDHRVAVGNDPIAAPEQVAADGELETEQGRPAFIQELTDSRTIAVSQRWMRGGGWVAVHEDITERRRAEAKIAHLAGHDLLTNLPNRVLFREHLDKAFLTLNREQAFAVLCLDLDRFKQVNDTLGHAFGDELLKAVAGRLRGCVKEGDVIARLGGDEFAIVQAAVQRPEQCSELASRVIEVLSETFDIDGKHVGIGASAGIAVAPADGADPDQLLKNADMALYLAKSDGRGTYRFFEAEMDNRLQARRSLEIDMRSAIANGEFELYYQPIVHLKMRKITGFEALLRWNHPLQGTIAPLNFISLAEETGLILPLGEWVLRTACRQAANWPEPVDVSINLSPAQFKSRNLVQIVLGALAASGLSAKRVVLEITESVFLRNEAGVLATLHQLRELGVRIAMDDFGTGYSSLSYLRSFPFDKIKIDGSFVRDMLGRDDCRAIVGAVAELARKLNMVTVVEGVETQGQCDMVTALGCDESQGYFFGYPVSESEALKTLRRARGLASAA
jgi:diguanylate cyclase (GGDEF)-like protein